MKLQQLRYLVQVAKSGLNVSDAAEALHTSQPGISKQIRLLEDELGVEIFVRHGKRVIEITEPGRTILAIAQRVLKEADNLKQAGKEFASETVGSLTIATTHTQARYALPQGIKRFVATYPKWAFSLPQGSPPQAAAAPPGSDHPVPPDHLRFRLYRAFGDATRFRAEGSHSQRGAHCHRLRHHQDLRRAGAGHWHPGRDGLRRKGRQGSARHGRGALVRTVGDPRGHSSQHLSAWLRLRFRSDVCPASDARGSGVGNAGRRDELRIVGGGIESPYAERLAKSFSRNPSSQSVPK